MNTIRFTLFGVGLNHLQLFAFAAVAEFTSEVTVDDTGGDAAGGDAAGGDAAGGATTSTESTAVIMSDLLGSKWTNLMNHFPSLAAKNNTKPPIRVDTNDQGILHTAQKLFNEYYHNFTKNDNAAPPAAKAAEALRAGGNMSSGNMSSGNMFSGNMFSGDQWTWPAFWRRDRNATESSSEQVMGGDVHNEIIKPRLKPSSASDAERSGASDAERSGASDAERSAASDVERLIPSSQILDNLRCFPIMSFSSCVEHCAEALPESSAKDETDLGGELLRVTTGGFEKSILTGAVNMNRLVKGRFLSSDGETSARKKTAMGDLRSGGSSISSSRRVMDVRQAQQFKICVNSICVPDYFVSAVPGCIDSDGSVVPAGGISASLNNRSEIIINLSSGVGSSSSSPDQLLSQNYKELDFYDPSRVHFYRDTGLFRLKRIWENVFLPENCLAGWLMIPIWLILIGVIFPAALYWGYSSVLIIWSTNNNNTQLSHSIAQLNGVDINSDGRQPFLCDSFLSTHPAWAVVQSTATFFGNFLQIALSRSRWAATILTNLITNVESSTQDPITQQQYNNSNSIEMETRKHTSTVMPNYLSKKRSDGYFVVPSEPLAAAIPTDTPNRRNHSTL